MAGHTDNSHEPSDDESVEPPSSSGPPAGRHRRRLPDEPVLPDRSAADTDVGWGDEPSRFDDDWYLRERPPHHG